MPKNSYFDLSSTKLQTSLMKYAKNRINKLSEEIVNDVANAFVKGAKKTLLQNATPKDEQSANLIKKVAKNINKVKKGNEVYVRVKPDREGLYMFLEYGTGLAGQNNRHPQASRIGWEYATRRINYIKAHTTIDRSGDLKEGFIFKNKGNNYIDREDSYVIRTSGSKKYKSKKTGEIKIYPPYRYQTKNWFLSSGITPVKYIYNTRVKMNRLIRENEGKTVKEFRKALKKF